MTRCSGLFTHSGVVTQRQWQEPVSCPASEEHVPKSRDPGDLCPVLPNPAGNWRAGMSYQGIQERGGNGGEWVLRCLSGGLACVLRDRQGSQRWEKNHAEPAALLGEKDRGRQAEATFGCVATDPFPVPVHTGVLASQGPSTSAQRMSSPASGCGSSLNISSSCGQMCLGRWSRRSSSATTSSLNMRPTW